MGKIVELFDAEERSDLGCVAYLERKIAELSGDGCHAYHEGRFVGTERELLTECRDVAMARVMDHRRRRLRAGS